MPRLAPASVLALVLVCGCGPIVSSHNTVKRSGPEVGAATFAEVRPGKTTGDWVLAALGEPSRRATLADGSELWVWTTKEHKSGSGSVWLLYGGQSDKETLRNAYVQVTDGVVTKKWRD
jgi:hypothetical protein